jgi:hypothetical protein
MSIDNPTTALDRALGAEERANQRVCELEDQLEAALQLVAVAVLPAGITKEQRRKLIAQLRPGLARAMA